MLLKNQVGKVIRRAAMISGGVLFVRTSYSQSMHSDRYDNNAYSANKPVMYKFHAGVCSIPHRGKVQRGGEDAHCVKDNMLGVFDGVSAWWHEDDIDAGNYSYALAKSLEELANRSSIDPEKKVLQKPRSSQMYLEHIFENVHLPGSSTACVVQLKQLNGPNLKLDAANVGDSGFCVYRNKILVFASDPQRHNESSPFQLGKSQESDKPDKAQAIGVNCCENDIIILATDGLWDNITHDELTTFMQLHWMPACTAPHKLAWALGHAAATNGSVNDDITVVVAQIVAANDDIVWKN